jgi:hypothetical protein
MFIECQNNIRTIGPKSLNYKIAQRLQIFELSSPLPSDLTYTCQEIIKYELIVGIITQINPQIANFICDFNNLSF